LKNKYSGFTLIEILVTLAIISIVAVIAVPSVSKAIKGSKLKGDIKKIVSIEKAEKQYLFQNRQHSFNPEESQTTQTFNDSMKILAEIYLPKKPEFSIIKDAKWALDSNGAYIYFDGREELNLEKYPDLIRRDEFIGARTVAGNDDDDEDEENIQNNDKIIFLDNTNQNYYTKNNDSGIYLIDGLNGTDRVLDVGFSGKNQIEYIAKEIFYYNENGDKIKEYAFIFTEKKGNTLAKIDSLEEPVSIVDIQTFEAEMNENVLYLLVNIEHLSLKRSENSNSQAYKNYLVDTENGIPSLTQIK